MNMGIKKPKVYPDRVSTDCFSITPNEAIFLMAHSLRMAAIYYQNIPEGTGEKDVLDMVKEMTLFENTPYKDPAVNASSKFIDQIKEHYDSMDVEDK